jgi:hypothetical protein
VPIADRGQLAWAERSDSLTCMTVAVSEFLAAAVSLPDKSRSELVEAILERSSPSTSFISEQMSLVSARIERIREGLSTPVKMSIQY